MKRRLAAMVAVVLMAALATQLVAGDGTEQLGTPSIAIADGTDVITAGTAIREAVSIIEGAGGRVAGVMLALDRQEQGQGELSAVQEVEQQLGVPVFSIIRLEDLISHLQQEPQVASMLDSVLAYRDKYGV